MGLCRYQHPGEALCQGGKIPSDCGHLARNFKEDTPSILITDLIGWMETYDKVRAKASSVDLCFPGHDAGMLLNYPKVAEDVTRLA